MRTHYLRFMSPHHPAPPWRFFVMGGLIGLFILGIFFFMARLWPLIQPPTNTIVVGVTINQVPVGGLTTAQAAAKIQTTLPLPTNLTITAHYRHPDAAAEQRFATPAASLGWRYDIEGTLAKAQTIGRTGLWPQQLYERWQTARQGKHLTIQPTYQTAAVQRWGVILAKTIDTVGRSPRIVVDGSGYRIDSGVRGISIDQSAFVKTLFDHPSETTVDVPIIVTATPLSPDGLARAQERLRKLWPVIISLQLSADERPLRLGARDFFPWLALPDGFQTDLIDQQLDKWSVAWQQPAQDAQFKWDGKSLKASEFQPEHEGRQLDQPQLKKDIQAALSRPTSETMIDIPVPFQPIAPQTKLGDLNKLGIKELIGIGHSSYMHSITNRVHNVSLTAKNINTTIVPAGAEFSFNAALGDVSKATGFLQAYVIKDNRTVLGDGGGVCQVSTTTFRAILNAGLPITAWKAHSYRVGYYEEDSKPGYDATVYAPSADLRFKNDTGHAIAIFTHTDDESRLMRVELWGTKDGRISTLSNYSITNQTPPLPTLYQDDPTLPRGTRKQVDWSAPGARTSFDYTVKNKDGSTRIQKSFVSNFQPWQAVYLVGTGN